MHAPLMGTYYHNMDAKGRMAFPNKLREQLGVNFVITIGLEGCLYVYSNEEWEKFTEQLRRRPDALALTERISENNRERVR